MPRRRTSTPRPVALRDLSVVELLKLLSSWNPQDSRDRARARWRTWREYLADYRAVRDELRVAFPRREAPFAEKALGFARAFGVDALATTDRGSIHGFECEWP